jgi:hypothetical protein
MSVGSPELTNNLVKKEKLVEQSRPEEASAQPEQAELKKKVINLKSVLLGPDGIHIQYTWVKGGNPNPNVSYTLPLGMVQEMVQRGVCIFSEGFDDSQGSDVEKNLAKLREFIENQENLRRERERERELNLLAETASELSFPVSKNPTEVAGVPGVSTGDQSSEAFTSPETDTVAAQAPEQEPDSGRIEAQQTDSSEQEPDSDGIESRINTGDQSSEAFTSPETDTVAAQTPERKPDSGGIGSRINELIEGLENKDCYEGLNLIERFLTSDEFRSLSVSPAEYIKIADAILEIVNRGIQSEGLKLFNYFLMMKYPACFDILDKAIGMGSTQTAEQLKERLTKLFIRIRDQVVKFGDLVAKTKDKSLFRHTLSEIIGQDKLHFLKLIYPRITRGRSQVDGIIQQVFAGPFGEWVKANTIRINAIATAGLEQVDENKIARDLERLKQLKKSNERGLRLSPRESDEYYSIKSRYNVHLKEALSYRRSILLRYKEDLSRNGPGVNEILTESDEILRIIGSLINNVDQIINLRIPTYL